jgi:hypothetical protein
MSALGQKATWLRSAGLECFAKLCDHRQRCCGAVVPVSVWHLLPWRFLVAQATRLVNIVTVVAWGITDVLLDVVNPNALRHSPEEFPADL